MSYDDVRLTDNFWLSEFSVSAKRPDLMEPVPAQYQPRLVRLCVFILQPIRAELGIVSINSGYRSPALNTAVGGSKTSQHVRAEAADCVFEGVSTPDAFAKLRSTALSRLPMGQVIHYPESGFIHIALPTSKHSRPTFYEVRGGTMRLVS